MNRLGSSSRLDFPIAGKVLHAAAAPAANAERIVCEERRDNHAGARVECGDETSAGQRMRILLDDAGDRFAVLARHAPRR